MRRRRSNSYRPGDFYRICDLSGKKVRASETVKLWNGLIVARDWYEERNPQDFVRARHDNQRVPDPRPENNASRLRIDMTGIRIDNTDIRIDQKGDKFLDVNEVTREDL
jgi:hypothetical protein